MKEKEIEQDIVQIIIKYNHFILLPEKSIYWKEEKALILSDFHIGKATHFRNNGIPISDELSRKDFIKLYQLLQKFEVNQLIVVGDLLHDAQNQEWEDFKSLIELFPDLKIKLIKGNHDKKLKSLNLNIELHENFYNSSPFIFSHEPSKPTNDFHFYFFGHIHPGYRLKGKANQSLRLPCFHLGANFLLLPAFSDFTGLQMVKPKKEEKIFAIAGAKIIEF